MFGFVFVAIGSAVVLGLASILWPVSTTGIRPEPLETVHRLVVSQPVGLSIEESIHTVIPASGSASAGDVAGVAVSHIVESVGEKARNTAIESAADQLITRWDEAPQDVKDAIKKRICK
jgi:hypothetical protein